MQSLPVDLPFASESVIIVCCLDFRPLIGTPRAPQKDTEKLDTWKFCENHQTTISEYLGNNFGIVRHLFFSCHKAKDDPKFGWRFHLVQRPCLVNRFWSSFFFINGDLCSPAPERLKTVEDLPGVWWSDAMRVSQEFLSHGGRRLDFCVEPISWNPLGRSPYLLGKRAAKWEVRVGFLPKNATSWMAWMATSVH